MRYHLFWFEYASGGDRMYETYDDKSKLDARINEINDHYKGKVQFHVVKGFGLEVVPTQLSIVDRCFDGKARI